MKSKKGQVSYVVIVAVILLILIFAYVFIQSQKRVIFGIQLQDQKIIEGANTVLFYTITNSLNNEIEEVNVTYQLVEVKNSERIKDIGVIDVKRAETGAFNVISKYLDPGNYVVRVDLSYYDSKKIKTKSSTLTLRFEVIEEAV